MEIYRTYLEQIAHAELCDELVGRIMQDVRSAHPEEQIQFLRELARQRFTETFDFTEMPRERFSLPEDVRNTVLNWLQDPRRDLKKEIYLPQQYVLSVLITRCNNVLALNLTSKEEDIAGFEWNINTVTSYQRMVKSGCNMRRRGIARALFSLGEDILSRNKVSTLCAKVRGNESIRWLIGQGYIPSSAIDMEEVLLTLLNRDASLPLDDIFMVKSILSADGTSLQSI